MSLEQKIEALTAAVVELRAAIIAGQTSESGATVRTEPAGVIDEKKSDGAKQRKPRAPVAPIATADEADDAVSAKATKSKVDYEAVKLAANEVVAKKGRDAAVAVLGEFGAKTGKDLDQADWAAFVAKCREVVDANAEDLA